MKPQMLFSEELKIENIFKVCMDRKGLSHSITNFLAWIQMPEGADVLKRIKGIKRREGEREMKRKKKETGKKKTEKKEKDEIWTNNCEQEFNITKLRKHLKDYNQWLGGNHSGMRPMMVVRDDYVDYLLETIDGKVPDNYIDSGHFVDDIFDHRYTHGIGECEIKHATRLGVSVLGWFDAIRGDYGIDIVEMVRKELRESNKKRREGRKDNKMSKTRYGFMAFGAGCLNIIGIVYNYFTEQIIGNYLVNLGAMLVCWGIALYIWRVKK